GDAGDPFEEHLRRGGSLVLAWSGDHSATETAALESLGLSLDEARKAPLNPLKWRRFTREEWDLRPAPGLAVDSGPVRIWAPRWTPKIQKPTRTLYQRPGGGGAMVAALSRHRGTIWLVPVDAFANARLGNAGNADLLETLRRRLGDDWTFDEYHHGLTGRPLLETVAVGRTLDLILLHLTALYLAAVLALARPFGPAWSEAPGVPGSAGAFLLGLGAIHHRLGHHREAAKRLLARVRELDRLDRPGGDLGGLGDLGNVALPADLDRQAETVSPSDFVALAQEVARRRRDWNRRTNGKGRPTHEPNFRGT
ncbi:MAG: hypothetical protein WAM82_34740, partial [Thermoanaerobaculia bacterium]